jgi:hypothetical protein
VCDVCGDFYREEKKYTQIFKDFFSHSILYIISYFCWYFFEILSLIRDNLQNLMLFNHSRLFIKVDWSPKTSSSIDSRMLTIKISKRIFLWPHRSEANFEISLCVVFYSQKPIQTLKTFWLCSFIILIRRQRTLIANSGFSRLFL